MEQKWKFFNDTVILSLKKPKLKRRNPLAAIRRSSRSQSSRYHIENYGLPGWQPNEIQEVQPARHSLSSRYNIENYGLPDWQPNEIQEVKPPPHSLTQEPPPHSLTSPPHSLFTRTSRTELGIFGRLKALFSSHSGVSRQHKKKKAPTNEVSTPAENHYLLS